MNNYRKSVKGSRVGAAIIDSFILSIISQIIVGITTLFLTFSKGQDITDDSFFSSFNLILIGSQLISVFLAFLYHTLVPYFTKGRSIGKAIVGIKIISFDYSPAKFRQLFFRNIFFWQDLILGTISTLVVSNLFNGSTGGASTPTIMSNLLGSLIVGTISFFMNLIILIMILTTEEERGFHDMIAKTMVVDKAFDIDQVNKLNVLEIRDMPWAEFEGYSADFPKNSQVNPARDDDDIELLK